MTEVLVFLNRLQRNIEKLNQNMSKLGESGIDLEKFRIIEELTDVVEMMENY